MSIKKQITVELSVDEKFFQDWLDFNDPDAKNDSLSDVLISHFKDHLYYHIDGADKNDVPYCATVISH